MELRGFLPLKGKFDKSPSSKQLCTGPEADKRYLINICMTINTIINNPRCPIKIINNNNQFLIERSLLSNISSIANENIPSILNFMSIEGMNFTSTSMSGVYMSNIEDEIPFFLKSTSAVYHSRQPSSSSHKSNVEHDYSF